MSAKKNNTDNANPAPSDPQQAKGAGQDGVRAATSYLNWDDVSKLFGLCMRDDCPRAADCLRHVAESLMPPKHRYWLYVTRALSEGYAEGNCKAYVTSAPTRVALGFTRALGSIPANRQYEVRRAIRRALGWSRIVYYRSRNGERPLAADEMERVAEVLARFGVPVPVAFDEYEDRMLFPD